MTLKNILAVMALVPLAACYDSGRGSDSLPDASGDPSADVSRDADADTNPDPWDLVDAAPDFFPDGVAPDYTGLDSFWDMGPDVNPECPPALDVETSFVIDGIEAPGSAIDLMVPCVVTGQDMPLPTSVTLTLTCTEDGASASHTIEIMSFPPLRLELALETEVMLHYKAAASPTTPSWTNRWFVIYSMEGSLLVSGTDAENPWPPDEEGTNWYSPLIPYVHEHACAGGAHECYAYERLSLGFEWSTSEYVGTYIYDRGEAWLGYGAAYHLRMGEATRRSAIVCPDEPETRYSLLVMFDTSG
jgi:hypothetical protein